MDTGDGRLLIRVITNLLTNAKKYNCTGNKIALSITQENGKTAVLCVKDDGQAIPPEIRDTMFCAFVRGESARRSTGEQDLDLPSRRRSWKNIRENFSTSGRQEKIYFPLEFQIR